MGNVIVGIPIGGQRGGGFRPFGLAGIGLIQQNTDAEGALEIDTNEFGFNVGGGVMGFFMTTSASAATSATSGRSKTPTTTWSTIGIGDFDFWRANVGVVFRW